MNLEIQTKKGKETKIKVQVMKSLKILKTIERDMIHGNTENP